MLSAGNDMKTSQSVSANHEPKPASSRASITVEAMRWSKQSMFCSRPEYWHNSSPLLRFLLLRCSLSSLACCSSFPEAAHLQHVVTRTCDTSVHSVRERCGFLVVRDKEFYYNLLFDGLVFWALITSIFRLHVRVYYFSFLFTKFDNF